MLSELSRYYYDILTKEDLVALEGVLTKVVKRVVDEKLKKELGPISEDISTLTADV